MRTKHTAEAVGSQSGIRRLNTTAKKIKSERMRCPAQCLFT